jgi:hypothetical protein
MTRNEFIGKVAVDCIENGVSLKIVQKATVCGYAGWFDSNKKELVCAYKNRNGFETLIHEYNHFLQWKNRPDFWEKCDGDNNPFLCWLQGDETTKNKLTRAFYKAVELERDCEINSIKFIKKHNLDVDLEKYTREANAYLYSYHYVKKHRDWPPRHVYKKSLVEMMPETILSLEHYKKGVDKEGNRLILLYEQLLT